jgi:hypothetical protein
VGGDFMHARMLLLPTFTLVLPAALLPARRPFVPALVAIALWAIIVERRTDTWRSQATALTVEDEHLGYVIWTKQKHPVTADAFRIAEDGAAEDVAAALRDGKRLLLSEGGMHVPMNPARPGPVAFAVGRLGVGGVVVPLDGIVVDTLGLANPLGARITATNPGYPGHEKALPKYWIYADFSSPQFSDDPLSAAAARHAMQCGALAELLDSARAPLTIGRFWDNLLGSAARSGLAIPTDPFEAESVFCGRSPDSWAITSSSSGAEWNLVDHDPFTIFSTAPTRDDHTEWVEVAFRAPRTFSKVAVHAQPTGFPVDFKIQVWDGAHWIDRVVKTGYPAPTDPVQVFTWGMPDTSDAVRLLATRLSTDPFGDHALRLADVEVLP